jgi:hypothetical protein
VLSGRSGQSRSSSGHRPAGCRPRRCARRRNPPGCGQTRGRCEYTVAGCACSPSGRGRGRDCWSSTAGRGRRRGGCWCRAAGRGRGRAGCRSSAASAGAGGVGVDGVAWPGAASDRCAARASVRGPTPVGPPGVTPCGVAGSGAVVSAVASGLRSDGRCRWPVGSQPARGSDGSSSARAEDAPADARAPPRAVNPVEPRADRGSSRGWLIPGPKSRHGRRSRPPATNGQRRGRSWFPADPGPDSHLG